MSVMPGGCQVAGVVVEGITLKNVVSKSNRLALAGQIARRKVGEMH
jgi:hypothetical protein